MSTTREIYLSACREIAGTLVPLGFKATKSPPRARRRSSEFTFEVSFQSSHYNAAGHKIALWIHAIVSSKQFAAWRTKQSHVYGSGGFVAGGQIDHLTRSKEWKDWNLAAPNRSTVIEEAISAVHSIALPFFDCFSDIPALCSSLKQDDLAGIHITTAIEFLLYRSEKTAADEALHNFFQRRSDLLSDYRKNLAEFLAKGLPGNPSMGFARELAYTTVAFNLSPPA